MYFKRVELIGFKSFADKQEITFEDGVTCIVGPNGCGKSNVADAIKWVLGEQSAKSMRGSSMQDVIFSGTQNRKRLSYCEVSLVFDNSDRIFKDLDYTEVVFTRKLYRTGESEYYVNRQLSRLRNIVDYLREGGISKEGYTIIGQGKVAEILQSKPADRRGIFEEAVGISKTKIKRTETIKKLDRTRGEIDRINLVVTKLEDDLKPLEKQAEATRTHRALSDQLKYHEVNTYLYKSSHAASTKEAINERIRNIVENLEQQNAELEEAIKSYNRHQKEIADADEYVKQVNDELLEKTQEFERQSGNAKVYGERLNYFRTEIAKLKDAVKTAEQKTAEYSAAIEDRNFKTAECEKKVAELETKAMEIGEQLAVVVAEIEEGERRAKYAQSAILKSVESMADLKQNIGALSSEKTAMENRQKETSEKIDELSGKLSSLVSDNTIKQTELNETEKLVQVAKNDIKDKESDISATNMYVSDITARIYKLNSEIAALEANKRTYASIKDNFEGFPIAVRNLLSSGKSNPEVAKRIKGVVANVIKTDAKYETAIEVSLGGTVQNVITASPDDAQYLIQFLKRTEGGRVTFLPVSSIKARDDNPELRRALGERGALGLATEITTYDKYFAGIVKFLLGNTLIADTIDNATNIAKKYNFGFKIVTLDGDVLSSTGSMSGGSRRQGASGLLSMDRRIGDVDKSIAEKKEEMAKRQAKKAQLEKQIVEQRQDLDRTNAHLQDLKQKSVALKEQVAANEIKIEDVKKEIEGYRNAFSVFGARMAEIDREFTSIESGNKTLEEEKASASSSAEKTQSEFDELKKKRDVLVEENTKVRATLGSLAAEVKAGKDDADRMASERQALIYQREKDLKTIEADEKIVSELMSEVERVALTSSQKEYLSVLKEKRASFEKKKAELNEEVKQDNLKREMAQAEITKLSEKKYSEEVALSKVDSELEYMAQRVLEEYEITYETALPLKDENYDITVSQSEIARLRKKIASLGNINFNAIEDYELKSAEYNDMATQRDDLLKAEEDLKNAIDQLTEEMSDKFGIGFAKIKTNFSRIFKELFGGGSADLVLEDSDSGDPLEQGIEIVAEPPGKKLQKISLLSGGEMSLTAIAILFAILKLRPMPFVVLDEIEAALDDANVERFANYLRNFSDNTQFIVITHKKVTMGLADALFGVTMQEKGVSKIVSVKLADVEDTLAQ